MKHIGIIFFVIAILLTTLNVSAQNPQIQWAKNVGGTSIDFSNGIAVDFFGNVYTVGRFEGTADFDPGPGIFNISSTGSNDIFVLKQDASGNFLWAKKMGSTGDDIGSALVTDIAGNVYLTGYFQGTADFDPNAGVTNLTSAGSFDIFVCKLDATGNLVWAKRMGGTGGDIGTGIALNGIDKVIFTGYFNGTADFDPGTGSFDLISAGGNNIFVSKLSANGDLDWARSFTGTGASRGTSITMGIFSGIEIAQAVYVTGRYEGTVDFDPGAAIVNLTPVGDEDIFVLGMTANGNFNWAKSIGSSTDDQGLGIAIDPTGNILLTGSYSGTADFDPNSGILNLTPTTGTDDDIFVLKLDDTGSLIWAKSMGGPSGDESNDVIVDTSGNVYTTGYFENTANFDPAGTFNLTANGRDIFISKLDDAGNFVWAGAASGTGLDIGRGIAVDMVNNIFSCGSFTQTVDFDPGLGIFNLTYTGNAGNPDGYILKLSAFSTLSHTITSFTPTSGPIGTTVTITGTNFDPTPINNMVTFNGTAAVVTASTSISISTTVPLGATTGKISVIVGGNDATSLADFTVGAIINEPPVIQPTISAAPINGIVTIDLLPLISDPDNNLDLSTLSLLSGITAEGASATLVGNTDLELNYGNVVFAGTDRISISVCDLLNACTEQELSIEVSGEIEIYNAVSANGDDKNPYFRIENIAALEPNNTVTIYNRWGSKVFEADNYAESNAFRGLNQNGNELPSGTYFYKILFNSTGKTQTGYLLLKR